MIQQGRCSNVTVTDIREKVEGTSVGKNSRVPRWVTEEWGGGAFHSQTYRKVLIEDEFKSWNLSGRLCLGI